METIFCRVCEEDVPLETATRCLVCKVCMCPYCLRFHNKFEKDHVTQDASIPYTEPPPPLPLYRRVKNFADLPAKERKIVLYHEIMFTICPEHDTEKLNLWCLHCEEPICIHCVFKGSHLEHVTAPCVRVVAPYLTPDEI